MPRLLADRLPRVLLGSAVLFCCMGTNCGEVFPLPRFLLLEPTELQRSGFCEDWGPGLAFHQNEECFRRENCLFDCPQICVADDGESTDSRDAVSPVIGTAPNGRCLYDMPWDPISGVQGHPTWWGHALIDVAGSAVAGVL